MIKCETALDLGYPSPLISLCDRAEARMAVGEVKNRCRDLVRQVVLTSLSVMSRKPTPLIDVTRREMLADGHVAAGRGPRRHGPPRLCPRQVQA